MYSIYVIRWVVRSLRRQTSHANQVRIINRSSVSIHSSLLVISLETVMGNTMGGYLYRLARSSFTTDTHSNIIENTQLGVTITPATKNSLVPA